MQDMVFRSCKQCSFPESIIEFTREIRLEYYTRENCTDCQNNERNNHHRSRFMHVMHDVGRCPRFSMKSHKNQTPGIETGEECCNNQKPEGISARHVMRCKRSFDNTIFREETGCAEDCARNTDTRKRQCPDNHHPVSCRNIFP